MSRRSALGSSLRAVFSQLHRSVESNVASAGEGITSDGSPSLYARACVALALTSREPGLRAQEFLRRSSREAVRVGDRVLVEGSGEASMARVIPTAMYGLAVLASGDRATALATLRTLRSLA